MAFGSTPEDPLGWGAIAQGRTEQDPLGWGAIARRQLPPELLAALSGQVSPGDLRSFMQPEPVDPTQQYLDAYGGDYLSSAMDYGRAIGVDAQDEKYRGDDYRAIEKVLADRAIKGAQAGYEVSQDQFGNQMDQANLGLRQQSAGLAERQANADTPNADFDLSYLESIGMTAQDIADDIANNPTGAYDAISKVLPMDDPTGLKWNEYSGGVNRMMAIVQQANDRAMQQMQGQAQAQQEATMMPEQQRWGMLNQGERAKELYMGLSQPQGEFSTDPTTGTMYTGMGAAARMNKVRANRAANAARPAEQAMPAAPTRDQPRRGLRSDLGRLATSRNPALALISPLMAGNVLRNNLIHVARRGISTDKLSKVAQYFTG